MKRLLNMILILCVLVTQSAWAIQGGDLDGSNSQSNNPQNNLTQLYTQPVDQHDDSSDSCNHFCHASAHLVGLFSNNTIVFCDHRDQHEAAMTMLLSSLSYQPPIPPPIS